ncbi:hypothetical protein [Burkholderia anthina]|uniref:hypothetical protein n=1 Tax=Burkholderia anthina TaxID=179879 RepID=UPI0037BFB5DA
MSVFSFAVLFHLSKPLENQRLFRVEVAHHPPSLAGIGSGERMHPNDKTLSDAAIVVEPQRKLLAILK